MFSGWISNIRIVLTDNGQGNEDAATPAPPAVVRPCCCFSKLGRHSGARCLLSASILESSMAARHLLRKLHIMLLRPIRTFFNYTFIAFVDAGLSANESEWLMGTENQQ